jgi:transcriptional regulator with XRE-family HTH domain
MTTAKPPTTTPAEQTPKRRLGRRLHRLRIARGWTLDQAAAETGVSRASLSKIEKGQMSPTFDAMNKLAEGFAIDITELFTADQDRGALGRRSVTRAGQGADYPSPNFLNELLAADIAQKAFLPFRTLVKAHDIADFEDWHRHDSEDFLFILEGSMTLHTELYEPITLAPGDSVYFDGRMGHALISETKDDAVILWISAPARTSPISPPQSPAAR